MPDYRFELVGAGKESEVGSKKHGRVLQSKTASSRANGDDLRRALDWLPHFNQ